MLDWINNGWDWLALCVGVALIVGVIGVFILVASAFLSSRKK